MIWKVYKSRKVTGGDMTSERRRKLKYIQKKEEEGCTRELRYPKQTRAPLRNKISIVWLHFAREEKERK